MGIEAYCAGCYRIERVRYALPPTCPQCGMESPWRSRQGHDPLVPWVLTDLDRVILIAVGIASDDDACADAA